LLDYRAAESQGRIAGQHRNALMLSERGALNGSLK